METWDLWFPNAAATGLPFARGRLDATDRLIVHAPAPTLDVEVRNIIGDVIAVGRNLEQTANRPMAFLTRDGYEITRIDRWPTLSDLGDLVILPGGEVGTLTAWWNAPDGSEWRWSVEFYNHR